MGRWLSLLTAAVSSVAVVAFSQHLHGEFWRVLMALGLFGAVGLSLGSLADRLLLWLTQLGGGGR
ncbi:MAG: hypothetical protein LKKZDAJK_002766 [Candidatus Fervidibacter sp.]